MNYVNIDVWQQDTRTISSWQQRELLLFNYGIPLWTLNIDIQYRGTNNNYSISNRRGMFSPNVHKGSHRWNSIIPNQ